MTARMCPPELATRSPIIAASEVSSSVSSRAMIALSSGLTERCRLRHERRVSPCLALAHARQDCGTQSVLDCFGAEELEAGAVDDHVDGTSARPAAAVLSIDRPPPSCQRRVIGHGEIELHHLYQRAHIALGLAQWQAQHRTEHQCRLDGQVGEPSLPARCPPARSAPTRNRILRQPHPDIATPDQPAIVLRPVLDAITRFGDKWPGSGSTDTADARWSKQRFPASRGSTADASPHEPMEPSKTKSPFTSRSPTATCCSRDRSHSAFADHAAKPRCRVPPSMHQGQFRAETIGNKLAMPNQRPLANEIMAEAAARSRPVNV